MVFCGLFPIDTDRYEDLRDALERLALNDAALSYEPETSQALGFGFRCGFLGLLHMDIVRERLEREYDLELLATTPNVRYEVTLTNGEVVEVHSPGRDARPGRDRGDRRALHPRLGDRPLERRRRGDGALPANAAAPTSTCTTSRPSASSSTTTCRWPRSCSTSSTSSSRAPPATPRSTTSRSATARPTWSSSTSCSPATASTRSRMIVHRDAAYDAGKALVERLRKTIPRQLFDVPVQAAVGSRVLARETVKALRKDVTAKLYGGDVTRKKKLLEKQKKGKKRMKQVGAVEVPQEAFLAVLAGR